MSACLVFKKPHLQKSVCKIVQKNAKIKIIIFYHGKFAMLALGIMKQQLLLTFLLYNSPVNA
jgi:hypothetical protein